MIVIVTVMVVRRAAGSESPGVTVSESQAAAGATAVTEPGDSIGPGPGIVTLIRAVRVTSRTRRAPRRRGHGSASLSESVRATVIMSRQVQSSPP